MGRYTSKLPVISDFLRVATRRYHLSILKGSGSFTGALPTDALRLSVGKIQVDHLLHRMECLDVAVDLSIVQVSDTDMTVQSFSRIGCHTVQFWPTTDPHSGLSIFKFQCGQLLQAFHKRDIAFNMCSGKIYRVQVGEVEMTRSQSPTHVLPAQAGQRPTKIQSLETFPRRTTGSRSHGSPKLKKRVSGFRCKLHGPLSTISTAA